MPKEGKQYAIVPSIYEKKCFNGTADGPTNEEEDLLSIYPDFSQFKKQQGYYEINGHGCERWLWINTVIETTHEYNMYFDNVTGMPVRYHMNGYNNIQGSHYDEYILDYHSYKTCIFLFIKLDLIPESVFHPPSGIICGVYPGPGSSKKPIMNPALTLKRIIPQKYTTSYNKFLREYNKKYNNKEREERYLNYVNNMKYIEKVNSENRGYTLAMNSFGDLSKEEMLMRFGRLRPTKDNKAKSVYKKKSNLKRPASLDWRTKGAVTPVKDQAFCGSCWTYGTVGTIEGTIYLQKHQLYNLSTQNILDCAWDYGNNGCEGGEDFRAYQYIIDHGGLEAESTYGPYIGQDGYCHFDKANSVVTVTDYVNVTAYDNDALLDALVERGPISVSVNVIQSFSFYSSGIFNDPDCTGKLEELNHSVLLVGYGTENGQV